MRVLIACDKYKGSLTAVEASEAIEAGFRDAGWTGEIDRCPIADGGEGFMDAMCEALGGEARRCEASDPLGRPVDCRYAVADRSGMRIGILEMAEASGLWRVAEGERDVMRASTAGTGQILRRMAERDGVERVLLGIGGSATNDGGAGMAAALGVVFLNGTGAIPDPRPLELERMSAVDLSARVGLPEIVVACDVENPLLGPNGATAIYGSQKGAGPEERQRLERFLARLVELTGGQELADLPGAGAAGGLGFGLMRFAGARLVCGFDLVADAVGLRERIAAADLVVTGEGSLDAQTLSGKGPVGVAKLARDLGKPVFGFAGRVTEEVTASGLFDECHDLMGLGLPVPELIARGGELLRRKVAEEMHGRVF